MSLRVGREQSSITAQMHDLRVLDESGALIETHESKGAFRGFERAPGWVSCLANSPAGRARVEASRFRPEIRDFAFHGRVRCSSRSQRGKL